ncbi:B3 domain-containing transcription repressor VAL2-like isoform X3 [Rosa rugosa]|uniref:B3 domain-containing transcription repressor VAL2-like isoform X3 n=1 Tax=Rosa rugosa TaxID=74645 RepID=UPI002B401D3B|nr:B3 domain-containing transcription repressor VAL2-like isoform X3 [Rosa rugosa]
MAAKASCFSCKAESDQFVNGWELKDGSMAQLCKKCGFAYVNGIFCETFHMEAEGWRDCAVCGKPLHCGCIMSRHKYAPLDFGGVGCTKCLLEVDQSIASGRMTRMLQEIVAKYKTDPTVSSDPTKKVVESLFPESLQAPAPQIGEESNTDASKGDTACEFKVGSETPQVDASTGNHLHPDNLPKMTRAEQLQKVSGNLNSDLIPLFEKSSTVSDTNHSTGFLVIPKKYAEEQSPRDIETGPTPVDTSLKADQEQSPRDIETGPTRVDTTLKPDQEQYPMVMETSPMPIETNQKTNQEQSLRDFETGPTPVDTSLKTDQEQPPKDMETSPMPVETSHKSDQGQSPKDMETGPTPVETSLKTDQEQYQRDMETGPTPEETNLKADQEQSPRDMETSLKTDKDCEPCAILGCVKAFMQFQPKSLISITEVILLH